MATDSLIFQKSSVEEKGTGNSKAFLLYKQTQQEVGNDFNICILNLQIL